MAVGLREKSPRITPIIFCLNKDPAPESYAIEIPATSLRLAPPCVAVEFSRPMKALSALLAFVVVGLLAALFFEHQRAADLQSSVTALARDRDLTQRELRQLNERVTTLQKRPEAS